MIDRRDIAAVFLTSSFPGGRQDFMTQEIGFAECRFVFRVSVTVEVGWPFPRASPAQMEGHGKYTWQCSVPVMRGGDLEKNTHEMGFRRISQGFCLSTPMSPRVEVSLQDYIC